MTRILLHLYLAFVFASIAACTSSARFVERTPTGGVVAVPDYHHRDEALSLIHEEVGPGTSIVDESEVVTGTDTKTIAEAGNGSIFTRICSWFTGMRQVASTETKTVRATEWRITYQNQLEPRVGDISNKGKTSGLTPAGPSTP